MVINITKVLVHTFDYFATKQIILSSQNPVKQRVNDGKSTKCTLMYSWNQQREMRLRQLCFLCTSYKRMPLQPQVAASPVLFCGHGCCRKHLCKCNNPHPLLPPKLEDCTSLDDWTIESTISTEACSKSTKHQRHLKITAWNQTPTVTFHFGFFSLFLSHLSCQTWGYIILWSILSPAKTNTCYEKSISNVAQKIATTVTFYIICGLKYHQ